VLTVFRRGYEPIFGSGEVMRLKSPIGSLIQAQSAGEVMRLKWRFYGFADRSIPKSCELRQVKYLNNLIEQDHRFIKRLTKPGMGFFSFETAWRTLQGYEIMNAMRKGQMQGVERGDVKGQVALIAKLFREVA